MTVPLREGPPKLSQMMNPPTEDTPLDLAISDGINRDSSLIALPPV